MSSRSPRDDRSDRIARFERALRAWADRPPRNPPEEAARRIGERLPERRQARVRPAVRLAVALAAAALVAAVGVAVWLGPAGSELGPADRAPNSGAGPPSGVPVAPAGDVLVIELDPETTLYMTLGARE